MTIMQYAQIGKKLIALESSGFKKPYKDLFDQTNASGYEVFRLFSENKFDNPFQKADEALYQKMGWWGEIFRDIIRDGGKGTDDKGRLHVMYISNAKIPDEKIDYVFAPKNGFWVPTDDGIFHPDTLIPFETVESKKEAVKRLEAKGIPKEQVSFFYRLDSYKNDERFVGRRFVPGLGGDGRFGVVAGGRPSGSGAGVAARPATEIVMKI